MNSKALSMEILDTLAGFTNCLIEVSLLMQCLPSPSHFFTNLHIDYTPVGGFCMVFNQLVERWFGCQKDLPALTISYHVRVNSVVP